VVALRLKPTPLSTATIAPAVPAPPAPLMVPVTAALASATAPFGAASWAQTAVVEATLTNTRANAYRKNLTDYLS
jgi:hypothetical protein